MENIEETIAWSRVEGCIEDLFTAVKNEFDLFDTQLLIEIGPTTRLIFVTKKDPIDKVSEHYLKMLPQIRAYCNGFIDAYKEY